MLFLAAGTAITALILTTGHWMPAKMSRLGRYAYGVSAIITGFAIWRIPLGDWQTPAGLLLISMVGGAAVWAAYKADHVKIRMSQAAKAESVDDELS